MIKWYLIRRWFYGVLVAAFPIAVHYGIIDADALPLWLALALALLNTRPPAEADDLDPAEGAH